MSAQDKELRRCLRLQVTKMSEKVIKHAESNDAIKSGAALLTLQNIHQQLNDVTVKIRAGQKLSEAEYEKEIEDEVSFVEKVSLAKVAVSRLTASATNTPPPSATPPLRLERLKLPTFSGDMFQFTEFWPAFKARVHQNQSLAAPDKFGYLNASLSGSAKSAIQGLSHDEAGYKSAIKLLVNRFGRRSPLINAYINKILGMPSLSDQSSAACMRSQCDQLNLAVRALQALGVNITNSQEILGPVILSRLPHSMQIKWRENHSSDDVDTIDHPIVNIIQVEELLTFFSQQINYLELSASSGSVPSFSSPPEDRPANTEPKHEASNTLHVNGKSKACPVCSSFDHFLARSCPRFLKSSIGERHKIVRKSSLCLNCLFRGHSSVDCRSSFRCRHCSDAHHTLLCQKSTSVPEKSPGSFNLVVDDKRPTDSKGVYPTLLAYAVQSGKRRKVRLLLDNCSNHSFVSPSLARQMQFPVVHRTPLTVHHFNKGSVERTFDVCNIRLESVLSGASLNISALVSEVCQPISSPAIDFSRLPHTKGLSFSDRYSSSQDKPVDVLIGYDFLYDLLTDSVRRGPRGLPVALNTRFGWTLHGPYSRQSLGRSQESSHVCISEVREPNRLGQALDLSSNLALSSVNRKEGAPSCHPQSIRAEGRFANLLPWRPSCLPNSNLQEVPPLLDRCFYHLIPRKLH